MASVMGICGGLVGPESENVGNVFVFQAFSEGSREPGAFCENEKTAEN